MLNAVEYLDHPDADFPSPQQALEEPNGLLAIGGDLSPGRLLHAYRNGIFPWFNDGDPILWWSPNPRAVFDLSSLKISRSTQRSARRGQWHYSVNQAFEAVIAACAEPRNGDPSTWICTPMRQAYLQLHRLGHAHSIEVWHQSRLIGGLYGVGVGGVFCGESMFHRCTDASKAAVWALSREAKVLGVELIDAQILNPHLIALGAQSVSRSQFLERLTQLRNRPVPWSNWRHPVRHFHEPD
ncbi:leucyl/phenylalanyl-tRNA--protein transferase [Ferrimonas gelatinilytica]|uniref:Leucyl/phenylalanyl-tRNA--protein transferase n=1 Tax=Ferrimonas gelatinilytica TaxID=1255257 RepID=A0ABP9RW14_9GAMM